MILILPILTFAANPKSVERDLNLACEISKEARRVALLPKYKKDPNALHLWIQKKFKAQITTEDLIRLASTVGLVDEKTRENIWNQTAKDLGFEKWSCPGIGEFL